MDVVTIFQLAQDLHSIAFIQIYCLPFHFIWAFASWGICFQKIKCSFCKFSFIQMAIEGI